MFRLLKMPTWWKCFADSCYIVLNNNNKKKQLHIQFSHTFCLNIFIHNWLNPWSCIVQHQRANYTHYWTNHLELLKSLHCNTLDLSFVMSMYLEATHCIKSLHSPCAHFLQINTDFKLLTGIFFFYITPEYA